MSIEEIRGRLAACPIPEDAQADWQYTNHYEIQAPGEYGWWWLDGLTPLGIVSASEEGKRLGAVLDYATHYKRDVAELLKEIERLEAA